MKAIAAVVLAVASLVAPTLHAQEDANVAAAKEAADRWLAAMDAGKTAEAWDEAAPAMQAAVPREAWANAGAQARAPFGAFSARKLVSSVYTRAMPGVPAGEYVVMQYTTDFANRAGAVETVTPMRQPDGSWKVSGYYIK
ncbi:MULTISPECIES: DUF4019 domain-containing protein [unclassified Massilia]|uniref:DUF4019 domain-containing protein n=1 Tax=unclassified Massilia TaxID=2609279 RepID=UPI0017835D58|nr:MULTISPECIES: DUF4019 domain-containing protein [unclassified Massilia]MBD8530074.1 DUF4019 domain-containing protein [Massilia sp. CFBP 13647]MBD8674097.1 DUF4019 domain-containing protein [Massilia sp. CFBP 13721]